MNNNDSTGECMELYDQVFKVPAMQQWLQEHEANIDFICVRCTLSHGDKGYHVIGVRGPTGLTFYLWSIQHNDSVKATPYYGWHTLNLNHCKVTAVAWNEEGVQVPCKVPRWALFSLACRAASVEGYKGEPTNRFHTGAHGKLKYTYGKQEDVAMPPRYDHRDMFTVTEVQWDVRYDTTEEDMTTPKQLQPGEVVETEELRERIVHMDECYFEREERQRNPVGGYTELKWVKSAGRYYERLSAKREWVSIGTMLKVYGFCVKWRIVSPPSQLCTTDNMSDKVEAMSDNTDKVNDTVPVDTITITLTLPVPIGTGKLVDKKRLLDYFASLMHDEAFRDACSMVDAGISVCDTHSVENGGSVGAWIRERSYVTTKDDAPESTGVASDLNAPESTGRTKGTMLRSAPPCK
jgi:hypothetical protein